jgi:hypothetical protein
MGDYFRMDGGSDKGSGMDGPFSIVVDEIQHIAFVDTTMRYFTPGSPTDYHGFLA